MSTVASDIRVAQTGTIYRNPKPAAVSRHAYFPSVTRLDNGDLVAAMDIGQAFESNDMRSYCCRSTDGGPTWSDPVQIFDPGPGVVSTTCRLARTNGDDLIGWACLFRSPVADVGHSNPDTGGFARTDFATVRSTDGGKTWSDPAPVQLPLDWHHFETCSPPIAVGDNRLLVPTSPWPDWNAQTLPDTPPGIAFVSDDDGQTFTRTVTLVDHGDPAVTAWEQKLIQLSDGRLMLLCWVYDHNARANRANHYTLSDNRGDSFIPAMPTPLSGETATPVALPGNRILVVYRRADDQGGLWAHLARIEADGAWTPLADKCIWGGGVQGMKREAENVVHQMSTLRFGCPTCITLDDQTVFAAFWCVEECVGNIRWFRINIGS
jgi:hypothetical protein